LEQSHWTKNGKIFKDFEIYVDYKIKPDEIVIVKLSKSKSISSNSILKDDPKVP
jgi:hypothetical protein